MAEIDRQYRAEPFEETKDVHTLSESDNPKEENVTLDPIEEAKSRRKSVYEIASTTTFELTDSE